MYTQPLNIVTKVYQFKAQSEPLQPDTRKTAITGVTGYRGYLILRTAY
jgi:hypothetical protein